ncbi:MAG TPA: fumarylacetoacetate hydrolase family protein [Myxococcota bacterium]|jgi:2-keto-4-pentenoate hydratase/2-oxohepta-3-ene-1,7-dioic acid hydratase in catechol pathway|nr:fumarylacetoacetate hydrolase family protein [Myxococcota bacterium]
MRLIQHHGRAALVTPDGIADLERASGGRLPPDPMAALARLGELRELAAKGVSATAPLPDDAELGPPVPRPSKVFGIGLNYRDHAAEAGLELPKQPLVFTKFPSCIVGPRADVPLSGDRVDYEAELVAVIGERCHHVREADARRVIAGFCAGQDVSDRRLQFADKPPQFSLGKSFDGYGPIGPAIVSLDELERPGDLAITCDVSGERYQDGRTSQMIFPVEELVAFLSRVCTLLPGDLIFTGTPAGVGSAREPRRYLVPGDVIETTVEGVGRLRNRCVAP